MKLTNKQRAQVVELLRCAADNAGREVFLPLLTAIDECDADQRMRWNAFSIYPVTFSESFDTWPVLTIPEHERETHALLEAAARVEEKSWP